jgi:hypothetical protein
VKTKSKKQAGHTVEAVEAFLAKKNAPKPAETDHAKEQARAQIDSIVKMVQGLHDAGDDDEKREEAETRINEDPLEIAVRCDSWRPIGADMDKPDEYMILLCTGGPACRIVGDLSEYGEPENAIIQYQDWGTLWTDYRETTEEEDAAILEYAHCFYFGE